MFATETSVFSFPEYLSKKILNKWPKYLTDIKEEWFNEGIETLTSHIKEFIDVKTQVLKFLLTEEYPLLDHYWIVITVPDRLQHFFIPIFDEKHPLHRRYVAKYLQCVLDLYNYLDNTLIKFLFDYSRKHNYHILIVSDHGFGAAPRKVFFVNSWLEKIGLLSLKKNKLSRLKRKIYNIFISVAKRFWNIEKIYWKLPSKIIKEVNKRLYETIDFENSYAYFEETLHGIRITEGLPREEYNKIRDRIIREIKELKKVIEQMDNIVKEKEELKRQIGEKDLEIKRIKEEKNLAEKSLTIEVERLRGEVKAREEENGKLKDRIALLEEKIVELREEKERTERWLLSIEKLIEDDINYRPYFILKNMKSCKIGDLAKAMGMSEGQVRVILSRLERRQVVTIEGDEAKIKL